MHRRIWLAWVLPLVAAVGAGCASPCHKGYQKSLECGAECELPPACRNRVHVFLLHGLTPSTGCGLEALRVRLGENGFAKVGSGELCHAGWVRDEVACIVANDPDARFVLVGYDYGGMTALSLARELKEKGVAVDGVVLLNPKGCGPDPCGVHTLLIADPSYTGQVPHAARVVVPGATHFTLPAHPTTVATVTDLLKGIAAANCTPGADEEPFWTYPYAPEVRPVAPGAAPPGWEFLAERPGTPERIAAPAATPAAPASTRPTTVAAPVPARPVPAAGPVAVKR